MKKINIRLTVNNEHHEMVVAPGERLVDVLRERLGLTGTKEGCGEGGVRDALANNICRCTGYDQPVKAVLTAACHMKEKANG